MGTDELSGKPDEMLGGVTLRWTSIPTRGGNDTPEVWMSCILQHTPLLISDGLYQQLNYSPGPSCSKAD